MITDRTKPLFRHLAVAAFVAVVLFGLMRWLPGTTALLVATVLGCLFGMGVERHG